MRRRVAIREGPDVSITRAHRAGTTLQVVAAKTPVSLMTWLAQRRDDVCSWLHADGAVLLRNFSGSAQDFSQIYEALGCSQRRYNDGHTPRMSLGEGVYTSTEYAAAEPIHLHSEMSYSVSWPDVVAFYCEVAPDVGGQTPIANNACVLERIPPELRDRFTEHGVLYRRVFHPGLGLSWEKAFEASSPAELEVRLSELSLSSSWQDGLLEVEARRPALHHDKRRDVDVWFNQAHAFHIAGLSPRMRDAVQRLHGELPGQAYFGNGDPIQDSAIVAILQAYEDASLRFPWRQGDLLILDNVSYAHGRQPFSGDRRILAALGDWPK